MNMMMIIFQIHQEAQLVLDACKTVVICAEMNKIKKIHKKIIKKFTKNHKKIHKKLQKITKN